MYRIAYRKGLARNLRDGALQVNAEYPLCLGFAVFAVRELLEQIAASLILEESDSLGVAVGFDSGDFVLSGKLTRTGLMPLIAGE